MAVSITLLDSALDTDGETASLTWAAGSRGVMFMASSVTAGGSVTAHEVTGGGVTWTEIGHRIYGSRRAISVLVSDGTPTNGVLDWDLTFSGSYQETLYSISQIEGFDSTTWPATSTEANESGATITAPDVGTIDAGDLVVVAAGCEGDGALSVAAGVTEHEHVTGGGNVRSLMVGTSTSDDTPAFDVAGGNTAGLVAILIKATAGAAAALSIVPIIQNYRNMRIM